MPSYHPYPHGGLAALTTALLASSPVCLQHPTMLSAVRLGEDGQLKKNPRELAAGAPGLGREYYSLATGHQVQNPQRGEVCGPGLVAQGSFRGFDQWRLLAWEGLESAQEDHAESWKATPTGSISESSGFSCSFSFFSCL